MRAISGMLVVDQDHSRNGSAVVNFANVPADNADVGDARFSQRRVIGGSGIFRTLPAYVATIREFIVRDDLRDGLTKSENDDFILNTNCDEQRIHFDWKVEDNGGRISEIAFLVMGE
ncbi:MAG: hypothetical protein H6851_16970 [Geminicoccaceae bacterium]|nr:hypothetical protein [Geminicoccaceae bacterium]MCB9945302.1 hypothetical protein [Geminicoccaceae bacterium]